MNFLLKGQFKRVERASAQVSLTQTLDKLHTNAAKQSVVSLIASPKGLSALFAAGVVKETLSSSNKDSASIAKSIAFKTISSWLFSQIDLSTSDNTHTGE